MTRNYSPARYPQADYFPQRNIARGNNTERKASGRTGKISGGEAGFGGSKTSGRTGMRSGGEAGFYETTTSKRTRKRSGGEAKISKTVKKNKARKGLIKILLPLFMVTGTMVLSLLIVKSDFIASPVNKPIDSVNIEAETPENPENNFENTVVAGDTQSKKGQAQDKYLTLINRDNQLEPDYVPSNMVDIQKQVPSLNHQILLERTAAEAFKAMLLEIEAAAKENSKLESLIAVSGYRTYEYQENLFNKKVTENLKTMSQARAETEASRLVALPGSSEHQAGLAIDVSTASLSYKLLEDFQDTACYEWLYNNCADFGFIIRYAQGKTEITGISYEPWHLRYVGAEHARIIMREGLTLEEYIERIS